MLEPVCVAQGSACNSKNNQPSLVLKELGLNDHEIQSSVRFSFTRNTTESEINEVVKKYMKAVNYLRDISPDYH
jgi:cysteine desulfurase